MKPVTKLTLQRWLWSSLKEMLQFKRTTIYLNRTFKVMWHSEHQQDRRNENAEG